MISILAWFLLIILIVILIAVGLLLAVLYSLFVSSLKGAPYIKNDKIVIYEALKLAHADDVENFVDLGSGNGIALFLAVDYFKVKNACGYEISPWPYRLSLFKKWLRPKYKLVNLNKQSFFDADLSSYNLIYIYLLPALIKKLTPKMIEAKIRNPNLKIVSSVFEIKGMYAQEKVSVYHAAFKKDVNIYLY